MRWMIFFTIEMMFSYYNVGTKTTSYMIDHWPFLAIEKLTLLSMLYQKTPRHRRLEKWLLSGYYFFCSQASTWQKTALEIFGWVMYSSVLYIFWGILWKQGQELEPRLASNSLSPCISFSSTWIKHQLR